MNWKERLLMEGPSSLACDRAGPMTIRECKNCMGTESCWYNKIIEKELEELNVLQRSASEMSYKFEEQFERETSQSVYDGRDVACTNVYVMWLEDKLQEKLEEAASTPRRGVTEEQKKILKESLVEGIEEVLPIQKFIRNDQRTQLAERYASEILDVLRELNVLPLIDVSDLKIEEGCGWVKIYKIRE